MRAKNQHASRTSTTRLDFSSITEVMTCEPDTIGPNQRLDLSGPRKAASGPKRPAIDGRGGVRVGERVFNFTKRLLEACGSKAGAKGVPGSGGIQAVDLEGAGANLAAAAARQLMLIEGEPGIGKTRLADEFLRAQPGLHLRGAAHELERALPYQPFIDALRELLAMPGWPALQARLELPVVWWNELARLAPEIMPHMASSAADESRLWEGVHQFLIALSRLQPIALFIDDAQWADASTLGLLGYLVRVTAGAANPIAFVTASRPIESRTPIAILLQTLTRENRVQHLTLDRLSSLETTALAQQLRAERSQRDHQVVRGDKRLRQPGQAGHVGGHLVALGSARSSPVERATVAFTCAAKRAANDTRLLLPNR